MKMRKFYALTAGAALLALTVACGGDANVNVNVNANANRAANANNTNTNNANTAASANNDNWNYNISEADFDRTAANWRTRASNLGDRIGSEAKDGWIHFKVRGALAAVEDLRDSTINADVENGNVTLRGSVASQAGKAKAEQAVKAVEGIGRVTNNLTVNPNAGVLGGNGNANGNAGAANANR
jgi:hypothetical protein